MTKENPDILYHYTTLEALINILDTANSKINVRASHAEFMHDPSEYSMGLRLFKESLQKYETQKGLDVQSSTSSRVSLEGKGIFRNAHKTFGEPFIFCLTENSDDLSMWKEYGGNGCGIAIGFEKKGLLDYSDEEENTHLYKCQYDYQEALDILSGEWDKYYDKFQVSEDGNTVTINGFFPDINISRWSFVLKNGHYAKESEWRLVKNSFRKEEWNFRAKNDHMLPFVEFNIPRQSISSLVLGPSKNPTLQKNSVELLIHKLYDKEDRIPIIDSVIPYRAI